MVWLHRRIVSSASPFSFTATRTSTLSNRTIPGRARPVDHDAVLFSPLNEIHWCRRPLRSAPSRASRTDGVRRPGRHPLEPLKEMAPRLQRAAVTATGVYRISGQHSAWRMRIRPRCSCSPCVSVSHSYRRIRSDGQGLSSNACGGPPPPGAYPRHRETHRPWSCTCTSAASAADCSANGCAREADRRNRPHALS